ncbi:hypothetical protein FisN_9Lh056 [Fistulifera solaris]|uniref:Uncharacterized protein n=1 Tax=Fistulifera solaris TaxID=1519565 RepID=A0A1Z5KL88_FISSO|nr:hypothetical protein FisN_9Lh056 [Fistulifera solaris]|eukprot:GAX26791.1 hypothetical protein FisN_9Lh056 [Fistulifera solaris]
MKIHLFLLLTYCRFVDATIFPLFPRLGCFARFATFRFDIGNQHQYRRYFRDDSAMSLWQTGRYVGAEAIREYVDFVTPKNPLWSSNEQLDVIVKFVQFDRDSNQCQFLALYHYNYEIDESLGTIATNYTVANMVKLFFNTRAYICDVYEGSTCASQLDPPTDCAAQLSALDQAGTNGRVDGNSVGCRILHAVLAEFRSVHCPHISFEPLADFQNQIKCQTEGSLTVLDLFTAEDLEAYDEYAIARGLDPNMGHDWTDGSVRLLA